MGQAAFGMGGVDERQWRHRLDLRAGRPWNPALASSVWMNAEGRASHLTSHPESVSVSPEKTFVYVFCSQRRQCPPAFLFLLGNAVTGGQKHCHRAWESLSGLTSRERPFSTTGATSQESCGPLQALPFCYSLMGFKRWSNFPWWPLSLSTGFPGSAFWSQVKNGNLPLWRFRQSDKAAL